MSNGASLTFFDRIVPGRALPILLVTLAAALRIWNLPAFKEVRDFDELAYVPGGLVAWEGLPPPMRTVPAGPQTWIGWFYAAGRSGWELLRPQQGQVVPLLLRPFTAIEQALFKTYEDLSGLRQLMLWISLLVSLAAVYGAYRLGSRYGGRPSGVLLGGLVAVLPLFIEFSGIAKPCSDAWMLAVLAISAAATITGTKGRWLPGVLLGLAIGSRVDMVLAAPLVLWSLWDNAAVGLPWRRILATLGLALATAVLSAPWTVEGFVGMLRMIGMARVMTGHYWPTTSPRLMTLKELAWDQGLGPVLLVMVFGLFLLPAGTRLKRGALAAFAALMAATMFTGTWQPLRYHGGPLVALLVCAAVATGALWQRRPGSAGVLVASLLVLPLVQSVRAVMSVKSSYVPEYSAEWIDEHVPAGTTVYLDPNSISRAVLPTEAAADAIWGVLAEDQPWRKKFQDGFRRFSLPGGRLPRAMSEDNLCVDRGRCRRWFILGGGRSHRPRYNVTIVPISPCLGLQPDALIQEFKRSGGVVVRRTLAGGVPEGLGEPLVKWLDRSGEGTLLYVSPEVREKLKAWPETAR
jgi:hypothetical protein